ncbi:hypothetical protein F01_420152 [Burkholderia cenocepacia]|nr:hypothetical protein F01_420152 [Burkholderia cenocepacia]
MKINTSASNPPGRLSFPKLEMKMKTVGKIKLKRKLRI